MQYMNYVEDFGEILKGRMLYTRVCKKHLAGTLLCWNIYKTLKNTLPNKGAACL